MTSFAYDLDHGNTPKLPQGVQSWMDRVADEEDNRILRGGEGKPRTHRAGALRSVPTSQHPHTKGQP